MAWPPDFRAATKATCPRSLTAWPTGRAAYGLPAPVSAMGVNVYESSDRSSRGSTVSRTAAGRKPGAGWRRVRARAELGVRERRIEESDIGHHLLLKEVCDRMVTALTARRPCAESVPGGWGACLAVRTPPA